MHHATASILLLVSSAALVTAEFPYQKPPKAVADALHASLPQGISVSPARGYAILLQPVRYPSISEVTQPMLRLAGIRIATSGLLELLGAVALPPPLHPAQKSSTTAVIAIANLVVLLILTSLATRLYLKSRINCSGRMPQCRPQRENQNGECLGL